MPPAQREVQCAMESFIMLTSFRALIARSPAVHFVFSVVFLTGFMFLWRWVPGFGDLEWRLSGPVAGVVAFLVHRWEMGKRADRN
jgi:hypothetical protein